MESQAETSTQDTTPIHVRCHCKTQNFTFNVLNSLLPLTGNHCYCNMCRQTNGALFESYVTLPKSVSVYSPSSPPPSTIKFYACSSSAERYFCAKCGTHLFFHYTPSGSWSVNSGAFTTLNGGIVQYKQHIFVEEGAKNDGLGLLNLIDDGLPRYAGDNENQPSLKQDEVNALLELAKPSQSTAAIDHSKRLPISCYCGRVKALLSRPSAHPDNKWLKQFATPDKTRWLGEHCGCESCRLSSGAVVSSFVFPSAEHLEWQDSTEPGSGPIEDGAGGEDDWRAKAGMTWWRSSDAVVRGFCGTCGAAVSYQAVDRPGMEDVGNQGFSKWGLGKDAVFDVYMGALRASNQEGERLSDWVELVEGLHHSGDFDGYDEKLKPCLLKGIKKSVEEQGNAPQS